MTDLEDAAQKLAAARRRAMTRVRSFVAKGHGRKRQLARAANVHRNTILYCDDEAWNPDTETLERLMAALDDLDADSTRQAPAA